MAQRPIVVVVVVVEFIVVEFLRRVGLVEVDQGASRVFEALQGRSTSVADR